MNIIVLGGTGHVGSATARALLAQNKPVTIVTRNANNGDTLRMLGAKIAEADIRDTSRLRDIFRSGTRAFLLNPPADPASDTDQEERANVSAILEALEGSGLEKVVVQSTYGARPGERCGDLTVLYEFEEKLLAQLVPVAINRGAYYMSNWSDMVSAARETGSLLSFFPTDMRLPMVAPKDLGQAAMRRLISSVEDVGLWNVEGPERYTPKDVANAFGQTLNTDVRVKTVPRDRWQQTFKEFGFSGAAAASYACMTEAVVDGEVSLPGDVIRGEVCLRDFIRAAVKEWLHRVD